MESTRVVNLVLHKGCIAKCIWCPIGRGIAKGLGESMSVETAKNIVSNLKYKHIEEIFFSQNGEGILNPIGEHHKTSTIPLTPERLQCLIFIAQKMGVPFSYDDWVNKHEVSIQ